MRRRPPRSAIALFIALGGCLESPPAEDGQPPPDGGPPAEICPGNLARNPSFEGGTGSWGSIFSTVARVEDALEGMYAAEVCWDGTSDEEQYYSLDDNPETVEDPKTGERYRVTAWVRAGPPGGALDVELSIREKDESGAPHPHGTSVSPDAEWQEVTSELTVETAAPQSVDVYVASTTLVEGYCFHLDAVCVEKLE